MRTFGEGNDSWACNDEILSLSFDLISMKKIRLLLPLSKKKRQWRKVSFGSILEWKTVGFAGVGCVRYMAFQFLLNIVVIVAECFYKFLWFSISECYNFVSVLDSLWVLLFRVFSFFFFSVVQFCLYGTLIIINSLNVYEAHMGDMQPARVSQTSTGSKCKTDTLFYGTLFFVTIWDSFTSVDWQAGGLTPRLHCLLIVALWFCCHWMMVGLAACWSGCHSFFRLKDQNALIRMQINCFVCCCCCCCCCYLKLLQLVTLLWVHCCCIATEQAPIQKLKFILFLFVRQRHENS